MSFSTTTDKVGPLTLASYSTPLAVTFPFQNKSDLLVLNIGPSATPYATAVTLTFNADYTVDGGGYNSNYDMQTGTVTVIRYGPNDVQINDRLVIVRNAPQNQLTSFLTNGLLTVAMIEAALDKGVTLTQAVEREVLHTLRIPYTESNLAEMTKTQRAGSVIAFDTDGNLSFTYGTTYYNGVATNAAAAAASATASESSAVASATSAGNSASSATAAANSATAAAGSATAAANSASQAAAVIPSQSGHAGQFLQTDGSATSWAAGGTGTVTSVGLSGGTTGLTASNTPVTTSGTITLGGTLAVANGGTGGTTAATARTNLGLGSIATQTASSVAITGGAIDGTTIGATTATTGKFTGVTATRTDGNYQYTSASATKTYGIATSGTTFLLDDVTASATRFAIDSSGNPSFSSLSTNGIVKATGSAGILTTAAAVSIATEVSGLGTGIATFLGTPTSTNLSAAVTDESGTGNLLFSVSPAMTGTPTVPTAAAGDNTTKAASTAYVQANRGDKYLTTSTSTNTIDSGNAKTFNCDTGLSYIATQPVTVVYDINNHMHCTVVSYSSSTGAMVVNSDSHSGSGTYSAWTINIGGLTSASGALLSANNLSDVASAATSATNLGLGAASAATLGSLTLASSPLPVTSGGTGVTTSTGTGAVVRATSPTLVTPNLGTPSAVVLTSATGLPLATGVTGTLPIANGGTGQTAYTDGQLLIGNTSTGGLSPATLTAGSNITITNAGGGITIASTGGSGAVSSVTGTANEITSSPTTGAVVLSLPTALTFTGKTVTGGSFSSPTLTTPDLGTPTAAVLTSATGLPLTTGVTGTLPFANGGTNSTSAQQALAKLTSIATTVTSATAVTLTNTSANYQVFTGSTGQTVILPVTSTLETGWQFSLCNNSTAPLTIQTSAGTALFTGPFGCTTMCKCIATGSTAVTDWEANITEFSTNSGTGSVVLNGNPSLTSFACTGSCVMGGAATSAHTLGTALTTGTLTIGGTAQTGLTIFGQSTATNTINIDAGATASGSTKTLNVGTGGLAGSTTAISIGSTAGTSTTTINGTVTASTLAATTLAVSSTSSFTTSAPSVPGGFGFRNRIGNGSMRIDQRNVGASITASTFSNIYALDRWKTVLNTSCAGTVIQQVSDAPTGFIYSHKITIGTGASPASGNGNVIYQKVEGSELQDFAFGTANAITSTFSFWVKSSVTGTYSVSFLNSSANRSYPAQITVNSANTWEQKTVTFTGDTSGTWLNGTGTIGTYLQIDIGSGTTYEGTANTWQAGNISRISTNVKLCATTGATFQFTGVQWEVGSAATAYEQMPYQVELARCQRYYSTSIEKGATVTNFTALNTGSVGGVMGYSTGSGGDMFQNLSFPVAMASNPSLTVYSGANRTAGSVRDMVTGTDVAGFPNGGSTSSNNGIGYLAGNTLTISRMYGFHYTADTGF